MPKPPTWISPRITTWPNGLQKVAVSTEASPVMHTADTDVKAAWMSSGDRWSAVAAGSASSPVPTAMATR